MSIVSSTECDDFLQFQILVISHLLFCTSYISLPVNENSPSNAFQGQQLRANFRILILSGLKWALFHPLILTISPYFSHISSIIRYHWYLFVSKWQFSLIFSLYEYSFKYVRMKCAGGEGSVGRIFQYTLFFANFDYFINLAI